jgi:ABC-type sulfate transport system substrate-binding protein
LKPSLQARAVIDGLPADIAALALPLDIMKIADAGLMRQVCRALHVHIHGLPARR